MKMTLPPADAKTKGMTLLEMTVVLLILLALVAILFISANAWKRNSDRSANILNLRNIQHAVRGHQDLYGLNPGTSVLISSDIFISGTNTMGYLPEPHPPSGTGVPSYTYLDRVPDYGQLYVSNLGSMHSDYVLPATYYSGW